MGARVVRVAINGYGVIGERVADAVSLQDAMTLAGVADVVTDYRIRAAVVRGYPLFASAPDAREAMRQAGLPVKGRLEDLLGQSDVVVDCTPKKVAAKNRELYAANRDAIRALTRLETDGARSIAKTDTGLGVRTDLLAPVRA